MTYFEPQPAPAEMPVRLTDPFAHGPPHPLARRAAEELQRFLRHGRLASGLDLSALDTPGHGKMFGVLVVAAPDGRIGYLRGFSGMLEGRWQLDDPTFPPAYLTLYVEGTFASGRLDGGSPAVRRGVLGSRAGDGRLALAVLQRQSARDTLYTMSARLSGERLLTLVTGDPGEERRWRRVSTTP